MSDSIDEMIELCESSMHEDIKKLQPKDRLNFLLALKDFKEPRMARVGYKTIEEDEKDILITVVSNGDSGNTSISATLGEPKED